MHTNQTPIWFCAWCGHARTNTSTGLARPSPPSSRSFTHAARQPRRKAIPFPPSSHSAAHVHAARQPRRMATMPQSGRRTTYPYVAHRARRARTSRSARDAPMRHAGGAHTTPSSRSSPTPNPVSVVTRRRIPIRWSFRGLAPTRPRPPSPGHTGRHRRTRPWLAPSVTHAAHAWGSHAIYILVCMHTALSAHWRVIGRWDSPRLGHGPDRGQANDQ